MNARALNTQHPLKVHCWIADGTESAESLCGGITAATIYLEKTDDPVDCRRCAWKLRAIVADELAADIDEDHEGALARERTYEFRRPRGPGDGEDSVFMREAS